MARRVERVCDICKRPTTKIVGKLHFIPVTPGRSSVVHSNYSHHADVGECCGERLLGVFAFHKRQTAKEYHESRRAQAK